MEGTDDVTRRCKALLFRGGAKPFRRGEIVAIGIVSTNSSASNPLLHLIDYAKGTFRKVIA
jgi:hypothetical protein